MMEMPNVAMPDSWMHKYDEAYAVPIVLMQSGPIIGQNVIYVADDGRHLEAAILTLFDDGVELRVIDPMRSQGLFRASPIAHDAGKSISTWHYPEE